MTKTWVIDRNFQGQGVHIDIDKHLIQFNRKSYMVRLETSEMIRVYSLVNENPHGAQLKFSGTCEHGFLSHYNCDKEVGQQ